MGGLKRAKAALMHSVNEPLKIEEVDVRPPKEMEVLVKIMAAGICSSDLHFMHGVLPISQLPIVPGHECSGIVEAVGQGVHSFSTGDRVLVDYVQACGACGFCREYRDNLCDKPGLFGFLTDGAFQQFVNVPYMSLKKLPDGIAFEQAAIMGCAVVTAYHAMKIANVQRGQTVALFGVGGVGFHAVILSKLFGCRTIAVDVSAGRLKVAREVGADVVIDARKEDVAKAITSATDGKGAHFAFDFAGSARTAEVCVATVRKGGKAVLVGLHPAALSLRPLDIILREVSVATSIDHLSSELDQVIQLVGGGKLDLSKSVTHVVKLDDVNEGIKILEEKIGNPTRVVILPN